jgi:hypothetical protein
MRRFRLVRPVRDRAYLCCRQVAAGFSLRLILNERRKLKLAAT